jgi:TRAP-type mannitol/chloroaromatic compound transport system permease large subunit
VVTDPERRRARGRRVLRVLVPVYIAIALVVGYLIDGWPAAITAGLLLGIGAGLGAWLAMRRESSAGRARPD